MWNPIIYRKHNKTATFASKYFLEKASNKILWKQNEKILDIGCGDGGATMDLILPLVPKDFNEILAIDQSKEMLNFAKTTYKHPKIKFCEYTFPNPAFTAQFSGYFNHIFALTCLHWIPNPREVLGNIANVLKSDGQALMTIMLFAQLEAILDMYNGKKWRPFLEAFQKEKTFPYQWHPDPVSYLADNLQSAKFQTEFCELIAFEILYSKAAFEEFSILLNPYINNIPQDKQEEFCRDYFQCLLKHSEVEYTINSKNQVEVVWKLKALGAFVQKIS